MAIHVSGAQFNDFSDNYTSQSTSLSRHQITSSMTIGLVMTPEGLPGSGASDWMVFSASSGETLPTNCLYAVGIRNISGTGYLAWFHEYGAGSNAVIDTNIALTLDEEITVVAIRDNTTKTVRFIVNGVDEGSFSYPDNASGGTVTQLRFGKSATGGQEYVGWLGGVAIWDAALSVTDAQKYHTVYTGGLADLADFVTDIAPDDLVCYYLITNTGTAGEEDLLGDADLVLTGVASALPGFTTTYTSPNLYPDAQQGYATDGTYHYITDSDGIYKRNDDATWSIAASNLSPFTGLTGTSVKLGDCCVDDTYLYVVANDAGVPGTYNLVKYLTSDLSLHSHVSIPYTRASATVAIDIANSLLYVGNYSDGSIDIYDTDLVYDSTMTTSTGWIHIQGLSYKNGFLYALTTDGLMFIIRPSDGSVVYKKDIGSDNEYEGIDYTQDELRYLSDEGSAVFRVKYLTDVPTAAEIVPGSIVSKVTGQNRNRFMQLIHH